MNERSVHVACEARASGSRQCPGAEFTLTSHEVMRGIKVRNGRLQLRPSGLVLFNTALDVLAT